MTALLALTGITKTYPGVTAVQDVSLNLGEGEIVGLLGENGAGKSTLMKVVAGLVAPDAGEVRAAGVDGPIGSPADAKRAGIGMVHQHFMLVPTMTVAENVALGHGGSGRGETADRIRQLSERYGLAVDPDAVVRDLSVGARQRVEIVRMLFGDPRILIFDEPTAVLTPGEWIELARVMRELAAEGRGILFITHKLDELRDVAQRCVVMRDGVVVETLPIEGATKASLARAMVGRDVVLRVTLDERAPGATVLAVDGLGLHDEEGRALLADISFSIAEGEIVGIAGVDGNGQDELVEVLTGLVPRTAGTIAIRGEDVDGISPKAFIGHGGAVIHADRHASSVADELSIADNLMMVEAQSAAMTRFGLLRRHRARERVDDLMGRFDVRAASAETLVQQLSGGNQQKVVIARELGRDPELLIAAQPTRGLDVGAVQFVYQQLLGHRRRGGATLLISTELDEVLSLSDRIAVISRGRLVAFLDPADADPERLGLLMAGVQEETAA